MQTTKQDIKYITQINKIVKTFKNEIVNKFNKKWISQN